MPHFLSQINIILDGTGTEIPTLTTTSLINSYSISGSATAIGNYGIVPTGVLYKGLSYNFVYTGTLDITTNSKSFSIFGTNITQALLFKKWEATCTYNGTVWSVIVSVDSSQTGTINTSDIVDQAVTTPKIADLAVTTIKLANSSVTNTKLATDSVSTIKILDDAVTTPKIVDDAITTNKIINDAVTTPKILDLAVTTGKINDLAVTTAKINSAAVTNSKLATDAVDTINVLDEAITNSKLALATASSVKIGDASQSVQDLVLGLDEIPIGDGTTVTTVSRDVLLADAFVGVNFVFHYNISWESTDLNRNRIYIPFPFHIENLIVWVTTTIEATNVAHIDMSTTTGNYQATYGYYPVLTAGASDTVFAFPTPASNTLDVVSPSGGWVQLETIKVTPGGKGLVSLIVKHL